MTMLPRFRHVAVAGAMCVAMAGLVAPSYATDNLTTVPSAAQIAKIRTYSKNAVAGRKASLQAKHDLVAANATLTSARAALAQAQVPLNAALDVQSTKQDVADQATNDVADATEALNNLLHPTPSPTPSPSNSQTSSPSATPLPSDSASTSPSPSPTPSPTATPLPIATITASTALANSDNIKIVQRALGVKATGHWDSVTVTAYKKLQRSIGLKPSKVTGHPDKKSLAALVKKVKAAIAKKQAAARAALITQARAQLAAANTALAKAQADLATIHARVLTLQANVNTLSIPVHTAASRVASLNAAVNAAQTSYTTNLTRLNAITSVIPYSSDICVPGQQIGSETSWDCGVVTHIADGDTIHVKTDVTSSLIVRTLGVQAPEIDHLPAMPAQCGGYQASDYLKQMVPEGTVVQLRSRAYASYNTHTSAHRYYREIYIKDADGNFTIDTADALYQRGLALWFPLAMVPGSGQYEATPNKRYFNELLGAIAKKNGMWSTHLCPDATIPGYDPDRDITPRVWAQMDPPGTDDVGGPSDPRAEYIVVKNPLTSTRPLDLSYWKLRDTALNFFMFPQGTVLKPGHIVKVYVGRGKNNPAQGIYFFGLTKPLFQNFDSGLYQRTGYLLGDGVYLTDRQGPNHSGGNMRAWFHNPCVNSLGAFTASCGTLTMDKIQVPDVVTQAQNAAVATIKAAHLGVRIVKVVDAAHIGKVTAMSIAAGTRVDVDSVITLTVGIAPTPTPTPTVTPTVSPSATPTASATP